MCQGSSEALASRSKLVPATTFPVAGLQPVNGCLRVLRCDVDSILYPAGMHYHRGAARGATSRGWILCARRSPGWLLTADAAPRRTCLGRYISSPVQGVGP